MSLVIDALQVIPLKGQVRAFGSYYLDPLDRPERLRDRIIDYMTKYAAHPDEYYAPYTSLIGPSMTGKSRLLEKLSLFFPSIYVCCRRAGSSGYPYDTPLFMEWINENKAVATQYNRDPKNWFSIFVQGAFFVAQMENLLELLKRLPTDSKLREALGVGKPPHDDYNNYIWMWRFFALDGQHFIDNRVYLDQIREECNIFWMNVRNTAHKRIREYIGNKQYSDRMKYSNKALINDLKGFVDTQFRPKLFRVYEGIRAAFKALATEPPKKIRLLFFYDEARELCKVGLLHGRPKTDGSPKKKGTKAKRRQTKGGVHADKEDDSEEEGRKYTSFRGIRKWLQIGSLQLGDRPDSAGTPDSERQSDTVRNEEPAIEIFGIFTDTSSRVAKLQPAAEKDDSGRDYITDPLAHEGKEQFKPIILPSSSDVYAAAYCEKCEGPDGVNRSDRLLRFGRPGWGAWYERNHRRIYKILTAAWKLPGIPPNVYDPWLEDPKEYCYSEQ